MARDLGLKLAVSTDAHSADGLVNMRFGVDQARRGWLEAGDVIKTRSLKALKNHPETRVFRNCVRSGPRCGAPN